MRFIVYRRVLGGHNVESDPREFLIQTGPVLFGTSEVDMVRLRARHGYAEGYRGMEGLIVMGEKGIR